MSNTEQEKLGKKLWALRRERKWTQAQMARSIGISRTSLSRAEAGQFAGEKSQSVFQIIKFLEAAP